MTTSENGAKMQQFAKFFQRLVLLTSIWWMLAGEDSQSWKFGAPTVFALAVLSGMEVWQVYPRENQKPHVAKEVADPFSARWHPWRLFRFVPIFFWWSLLGGCDVAYRAIHPRLPIAPAIRSYTPLLPTGSTARVFFANCISLLPGTLTADWEGDLLRIHELNGEVESTKQLQSLEREVAMLFGHRQIDHPEDRGRE